MKRIVIVIIEIIIILIFGIILLNNFRYKDAKYPCYKVFKYSNGLVIIGNSTCIKKVESKGEDDYLVLDDREAKNPNMKIYDSYKVKDEKVRREILEKLLLYESMNPSWWKRTMNSLENEWDAHNKLYNLNFKRERTKDVDLDNNDEDLYQKKLGLTTIIKYYTR